MKERQNEQPQESAAPVFDELVIETVSEVGDEFLKRVGPILGRSGGVPNEEEEKLINELLTEYNVRFNELLAQKRRERIK